MPELPEVEIVRQSLNKKIKQKKVKKVIIRNRNLRFKIPSNFNSYLKNKKILIENRYKDKLKIVLINIRDKTIFVITLTIETYNGVLVSSLAKKHTIKTLINT